ncbi:hypothetical protein MNBD_CHLOROFLEXI01-3471 [hydrothermal vent metagenome]|uniref:histidine kinase n=1 Tax=hydrothermal vent metagenome TaxID=652676 RepID=A0A3B0VSC5_9ZZZZ
MFSHWRLRTRLVAAFVGLILLGFTGLSLLAGNQIAAGAVEDYERSLETQVELVGRSLEGVVEDYFENEASFAEVETAVSELANNLGLQITLIDVNGLAWISSDDAVVNSSLQQDPEVAVALNGEENLVFDTRLNDQNILTLYTAAPIIEDGQLISVVRIAVPASATNAIVNQRFGTLAIGIVTLTMLAVGAALWLSASFTRPLEMLQQSAMRLAEGDLSQRVARTGQDELGQLGQMFNHMAAQVEAMLMAQQSFASNASHELRTPLTTIRLRSEALRDGGLDAATTQQYIVEIDDEAARLGRLVHDLMQLSRFDSGRAAVGGELIDPLHLGRSVYGMMMETAVSKNISLRFEAPDHLPSIQANSNHLRMVLHNLLDNALKYTPEGGQVVWRLAVEDGWLRSEVADSGVGLAPDDIPHLFERFYRADKAHARATGGTGLGLPLAQSIVQFYNGRVQLHSDGLGKGTTATVYWPLPNRNSSSSPL